MINGNEAVAASFVPKAKPKFKLTVSKSGTGSGTVTSTPAGINCGTGAGCEHEYEEGTVVTLSQSAASGSEFKGWTGCTSEEAGKCKVTMSAAKSVGAKFEAKPTREYTLAIELTGSGSGLVNCDGGACAATYKEGAKVTLSATALPGSVFAGWSGGGCSGTAPCKVTMSANKEVKAEFKLSAKTKFKLTVTRSGPGRVTSAPAGIDCGATCSAEFEAGKLVELKPEASPGFEFAGWSGACSGTGACKVTMSQARAVSASFVPARCRRRGSHRFWAKGRPRCGEGRGHDSHRREGRSARAA